MRINSGTLNPEGVRAVGELYRADLEALGFKTRWIDMPPAMKRAGHLVATHEGDQGKRVLLLGHMDTVFEKGSSVPLWERRGDRVRGQGVNDMKGGDVIMIQALRALKARARWTERTSRSCSPATRSAPVRRCRRRAPRWWRWAGAPTTRCRSRAATSTAAWTGQHRAPFLGRLGAAGQGQGGAFDGRVLVAIGFWRHLRVRAHPQRISRAGDRARPDLQPGPGFGGTNISYADDTATASAFGKSNVIARDAEVLGDLRYLSPEQGERARQKMQAIVSSGNLPGTSASISFSEGYPPMPPTEAGRKLAEIYSQASVDAGLGRIGIVDPSQRGAGDVQFVAPYTVGIDGLGAQGRGAHTDDEELEIASIERGAVRAALLIYRLTQPPAR